MDARNRATAWGQPNADAQTVLDAALPADVLEGERQALRALILDALRCLHEGVLARYGVRPSQRKTWLAGQGIALKGERPALGR